MLSTNTTRQARLKPSCADSYPQLPVSVWTSAESLAEIVAPGPRDPSVARILLEADFEFRGGGRRPVGWVTLTRSGELA